MMSETDCLMMVDKLDDDIEQLTKETSRLGRYIEAQVDELGEVKAERDALRQALGKIKQHLYSMDGWEPIETIINEALPSKSISPTKALPCDKRIKQVAHDATQQDWDKLEYYKIAEEAFIEGAEWMKREALSSNQG